MAWTAAYYRFADAAAYRAILPTLPTGASVVDIGICFAPQDVPAMLPGETLAEWSARQPAPVALPGYHACVVTQGEPPWPAHRIAWEPGLPQVAGLDEAPSRFVPESVPRGAARIVMASAIYPAGHPQADKSVLRRVKELLAAADAATAPLPDSDPRKIGAVVQREAFDGEGEFLRHGATTLRLAEAAEVSAEWMDELFIAAAARAAA